MMTLNSLLEKLKAAPDEATLVFKTDQGNIGAGYHVTELKYAKITGIDCGARISEWVEASVQLLDGAGRSHMPVSKFTGILEQSIRHVDGLGEASAYVEFAPRNEGKRIYQMDTPVMRETTVIVQMNEVHAICKPAKDLARSRPSDACCSV